MKESKLKNSKLNIRPAKTERLYSPYKDSPMKTIVDDSKPIIFMPEDQIQSMFKKEKKKKKIIAIDKNTRDVSHIKDKIKSKLSVPLLLPTNISQLKGLLENTSSIVHHKSVPALGQTLDKPSYFTANEQSILLRTMQPEPAPLERENLGKPSSTQDIESLTKWYNQMKKSCSNEEEFEVVFKVCVKEVIRQVSVHCKLRGKLVKEIMTYQQNFYLKKLKIIESEFESYKKNQAKMMQKINEEFKIRETCLEEEISEMRNKIAKFETEKSGFDECLLRFKVEICDLNRTVAETEKKWKMKAERYLKELNRTKRDVYRGTCKLAKFISRNEISELAKGLLILDSVSENDRPEVERVNKALENYEIELVNLFTDLRKTQDNITISVEVSDSDFQNPIKEADSNLTSSKSSENELQIEKQQISFKGVFSQSPRSLIKTLHKTKSETFNLESLPQPTLPHSKSYFLISNPEQVSKSCEEKVEEGCYSNSGSLEQYYNFTDEEDSKTEPAQNKMIPLKPIELEINEAASELEESHFTIPESKNQENSYLRLEPGRKVLKTNQFTQTEQKKTEEAKQKIKKIHRFTQTEIEAEAEINENSSYLIESIKRVAKKSDSYELKKTIKAIKEVSSLSRGNEEVSFSNTLDLDCEKTDNGTLKINTTEEIEKAELLSELSSKTNEDLRVSSLNQDLTQAAKIERTSGGRGCVIRRSITQIEEVSSDPKSRKKSKASTKISEFNFHSPRKCQDRKKANAGPGLLEKFFRKSLNKIKMRATFSRKNINRTVLGVYFEGLNRLQTEGDFNLIEIAYDEIVSKYTTKAAGEKKFLEFFASVVANSEYKRCLMFLKINGFGSLVKSGNYSKISVCMYLNVIQFIFNSKIGIFLGNEDDDKVMIPTIRIIESIKEKIDIYDRSVSQDLLGKAEKLSIPDPLKINPAGVVELETMLEYLMDKYEAYSSAIYSGLVICLKGLGYDTFCLISWIDIQMILRFFYKPYTSFNKDLMFDELLAAFIKLNYCSESELLKFFDFDKDMFKEAGRELEVFKKMAWGLADDFKDSHSAQTFRERAEILEKIIVDNAEICFVGIMIQKAEIERLGG